MNLQIWKNSIGWFSFQKKESIGQLDQTHTNI